MSLKRRVFLIAAGLLVALPMAGALYLTLSVRSEAARFPPPGRLINIAGRGEHERRIHLICLGQGGPTVIFEPSGFGGALSSRGAREEVSAHTRVCSYDRVGMGWSDPVPGAIPVGMLADDLELLTIEADLPPPFILVPASIGGLSAELFARRHPDRVAGMVFVDAVNSVVLDRFGGRITHSQVEFACLAKTAAKLGIRRLLDPFGLRKQPPDESAQNIARLYRAEPMTTFCGLARGFSTTMQEFTSAPTLSTEMPLIVLVHEKPVGLSPPGFGAEARTIAPEWLGLQQRFAAHSRRGIWRIVSGSDHLMGNSQPHAVASAVTEMLAEVRRGR